LNQSEDAPQTYEGRGEAWLILLLAAVTAIGPFTLHALSPALPEISKDFDIPAAASQLMLSLSLVAMAISTLIWGPLSDRFGRLPVMLAGMVMAAVGSALAAMAPEIWIAIIGRLLQAAGGAAGMVLARAVAQDIFGSQRAAGVIGQITAVMVAAPMIAPTLSGFVVEWTGWRGTFWMSTLLAGGLVIWTRYGLVESLPARTSGRLGETLRGIAEISGSSAFWRYAGYAACSLAGFYYFVGITPYVMQAAFGQGPAAYGLYFMLLSATYMVTNFVCGPIGARFGGERVMMFGASLSIVGPALSALLLLAGVREPLVLFAPGMIQSFGAGLAVPNAMAGAVASAPQRAGAASGLLGFSQFLMAAVTTQIAGFLPHSEPLVVPFGMILMLVLGPTCLTAIKRPV
jgi:DHA1 family bicyclomycin/chloramphenicol resistance-like MFS transporter